MKEEWRRRNEQEEGEEPQEMEADEGPRTESWDEIRLKEPKPSTFPTNDEALMLHNTDD